eukprot:SAG31_NODE_1661_length_7596_cov_4.503802_4_plen_165_part_00
MALPGWTLVPAKIGAPTILDAKLTPLFCDIAGLEDEEVAEFMALLDADGSGGLDYDEFLQQFRDLEEAEGRSVTSAIKARGAKMTQADLMAEIREHSRMIEAGYKPGQGTRPAAITPAVRLWLRCRSAVIHQLLQPSSSTPLTSRPHVVLFSQWLHMNIDLPMG